MNAYHFIGGCKGEELDYYFTDVVGNVEISNWYWAHYYRSKFDEEYGCFQYVGLEEYEPKQQTTLYIVCIDSEPYDNCECTQSTHDIYEFVSCDDKPIVLRGQYVKYDENVNCEFVDAIYNKAMSEKNGVEFCCEKDLQQLTIKKKLLDAGQLQDDIDLCLI